MTGQLPHPEIFAQHVRVGLRSGCWLWTGALFPDGYGMTGRRFDGGTIRAHRVAHELYIGPIPAGMQVLHRCDNPRCVNPEHLWLGTHDDNMADMVRKNRCPGNGRGKWRKK